MRKLGLAAAKVGDGVKVSIQELSGFEVAHVTLKDEDAVYFASNILAAVNK
ncbi:hypothetical protein ACFTSD_02650 [Nocardiaceae bacterium NPDC056970]